VSERASHFFSYHFIYTMSSEVSGNGDKHEYTFKILIVGEPACGKTCILQRYVKDVFLDDMKATVGVDFYVKEIEWDKDTIIRLQFWDIAGQERYGHLTPVCYLFFTSSILSYGDTIGFSFLVFMFLLIIDLCF